MIPKKAILGALTKNRLIELSRAIGCAISSARDKASVVAELVKTETTSAELLRRLSRDDLKKVCRSLQLSENGREKKRLRARIYSSLFKRRLRTEIRQSLKLQGFDVRGNCIELPKKLDKQGLRDIHAVAVKHRVARAAKGLRCHEPRLLGRIANGSDVCPDNIRPRLVAVRRHSEDELLFRYVSLHWSIPVSCGYGRRLRFLVLDDSNGKLIGLIGLGDPVFSLRARDAWVDWTPQQRAERLQNVMDAFVLGAVPPYSMLLGGKLVALLATSDEVRRAFKQKYHKEKSVIRDKPLSARLALLTTTSALGRSSVYNRLKDGERLAFESVGFTQGSGEFQFFNGVYDALSEYAVECLEPTAKHSEWGTGFRNRREVVRKSLADLGLAADWLYHGIRREIFVAPLAKNACEFLRGEHSRLLWHNRSADDLFDLFRGRWLIPRSRRNPDYRDFAAESYRLWDD